MKGARGTGGGAPPPPGKDAALQEIRRADQARLELDYFKDQLGKNPSA